MMRKLWALVSCVVLLLTVAAPLGVAAEGIDVSEVSVDTSSALWVVTWSGDEAVRLLSVQLSGAAGGNATLSVTSSSAGYAEVDASAAPYGTSSIDLAFGTELSAETAVMAGGTYTATARLQTQIALDVSDTLFAVTVTDENGNPVAGAPVSVDIGSTTDAMTATTDDYGGASFNIAGMEGGYTWTVHVAEFDSGDGVTYLASSASQTVGEETPVTTKAPETQPSAKATEPKNNENDNDDKDTKKTAPQLPTLPSGEGGGVAELPAYEAVRGATTTNASKTEIACNLSVDKTVLSALKLKIGAFDKAGRLVVSKENYETLAKLYGGTLMGSLTASPFEAVTAEQIETAKQGESMFSESTAEKAVAVTFGLALDFLMEDGQELHVTDVSDSGESLMFDVQIPVPGTMKKCKSFGIAMTGDNVLTPLTQVNAENGVISFRTAALGYYTLVGFTDGKAAAATGGASPLQTLFIVLIVVGALFLLACGFFTYWFFFRKKGEEPPEFVDPEDDAYYDGETPTDEQEHADEQAFRREVLGEDSVDDRDLFSSAEREREAHDPIMSAREEVARGGDDIFGLYSRRIDD